MNEEALILETLLDSSESSSDEDLMGVASSLKAKKPKIENYIAVVKTLDENQFRQNFRMKRSTVMEVAARYKTSQFFPRYGHGGGEQKDEFHQILSFLWFAGNKSCLRDVAERFGIGITTLFRQITHIIEFLVDIAPQIIVFPRTEKMKRHAADAFANVSGFPNVIGCIDGTTITIKAPANKLKSTYVNRHDVPSVVMQGISDKNKKFNDVFTGAPGKLHDSRVFKLSFIEKEIENICGQTYHLLGDSAYPIRQYLITPYRDYGNLTEQQKTFNTCLSSTRVLIENAFGLLKGRWRQLLQIDFHDVDKISKFILACASTVMIFGMVVKSIITNIFHMSRIIQKTIYDAWEKENVMTCEEPCHKNGIT